MSAAATIRPEVVNSNAARILCTALRDNIEAVLKGPMFKRAERTAAVIKASQCQDIAQLQKWYRNLHKERQRRETACQWAGETGDYVTGLDAIPDTENEADWQTYYDTCDKDLLD